MKFKYSNTPSVPYEEAKRRVISYLRTRRETTPAAWIAEEIWPGNKMRSQGAGGAASRILRLMSKEGLVEWSITITPMGKRLGWGWKLKL